MKLLKVIFIVIIVLILVSFLAIFIFVKTVDINKFKSKITEQIVKVLNREVYMDSISLDISITSGIVLGIDNLAISDDIDFSKNKIIEVSSARLDVDTLALILKRKLVILKVELLSPTINIIRNEIGEMNIQRLASLKDAKAKEVQNKKEASKSDNAASIMSQEKSLPSQLLINNIRVKNGKVVFIDKGRSDVNITLDKLDIEVLNFSFEDAFTVKAECALWSDKSNISLRSRAKFDDNNTQIRIDGLEIKTDLADISVDRAISDISFLSQLGIERNLVGKISVKVNQMILGKGGLLVLSSDGSLNDGKIKIKYLEYEIENVDVAFEATESDISINDLFMNVASGRIVGNLKVHEYLKEKDFTFNTRLEDLRLEELISDKISPVKIEGSVFGEIKGEGTGIVLEDVKRGLNATSVVRINNGKLVDINVLKLVLNKISIIPNLLERIFDSLDEKYKQILELKDTTIKKAKLDLDIKDGIFTFKEALVVMEGFLIKAKGEMDFEQNLKIATDFYIEEELSANLIAASKELSYLLNEKKQIHIPFQYYSGKLRDFRVFPNLEYLGKKIIKDGARQELKKAIFKALDLGGNLSDGEAQVESQSESSEGGSQTQEKREVRPEAVIIENVLDAIFK
ncbi:MAG: AsmA family protein [Candidatus Zapsychrus exili]|nr:AsmA family protein [Candidatus Zapsychrus exili]